jgi:hypothetical protein
MDKEKLFEQASGSIIVFVDSKIWRTKRRIQELMMNDAKFSNNEFVRILEFISRQLHYQIVNWDIIAATREAIDWEIFEEWEWEPVLFTDIIDFHDDPLSFEVDDEVNERMLQQQVPLTSNKTFDAIRERISKEGLVKDTIFYRRVDSPNSDKSINHPRRIFSCLLIFFYIILTYESQKFFPALGWWVYLPSVQEKSTPPSQGL